MVCASNTTKIKSVVAVGDFNIAPYEHDVWSHKQLLNVVSHTPPETLGLEKMRQSLEFMTQHATLFQWKKRPIVGGLTEIVIGESQTVGADWIISG